MQPFKRRLEPLRYTPWNANTSTYGVLSPHSGDNKNRTGTRARCFCNDDTYLNTRFNAVQLLMFWQLPASKSRHIYDIRNWCKSCSALPAHSHRVPSMQWTTRGALVLLILPIIGCLVQRRTIHAFGEDRTLLLTAHPDDETFFFGPTLTAFNSGQGSDLFVVSLSTGNAKGLGDVRREEFGRALDVFGVQKERRFILDHPCLQDNKTSAWDPAVIANELYALAVEHDISTILTFDSHGITGHPNHQSALAGAIQLVFGDSDSLHIRPRLFALHSRSGGTKHLGPLATLFPPSSHAPDGSSCIYFSASLVNYVTTLRAMLKHPSQLRLFPFLKGLLSRYLWVNEWVEVTTHPDAPDLPLRNV